MRYYAIKIDGAPAAFPAVEGAYIAGAQWCTLINGRNDPSAQQVEFQLEPMVAEEGSSPVCTVTIHGVPLAQIAQYANLAPNGQGYPVSIYGGMSKGLPLATHQSQYAGLLISGQIKRSWGQWNGKEQSLSFSITPGMIGPLTQAAVAAQNAAQSALGAVGGALGLTSVGNGATAIGDVMSFLFGQGGTIANPLNIIHNLMPNLPLSNAIQQTLKTAFPGANTKIAISPMLKLPTQDAGMYQSLTQYAAYLKQLSMQVLGGNSNYTGIKVSTHGPSLNVWDDTINLFGYTTQIQYADLIGQPTWIGSTNGGSANVISFKTVLRSDIFVGSHVTLPPTLMSVTEGGFLANTGSAKSGTLAFEGDVTITHVNHTGDSRNPDGNAWSSNFEGVYNPTANWAVEAGLAAVDVVSTWTDALTKALPSLPTITPQSIPRSVRRYV